MATARAEGCGLVPVASSQRNMDSRIYSPAQCVGQLAENSAAKGNRFNATTFEVSILSQFESIFRPQGTEASVCINSQALKALDDGVGFLYDEVEDMLSYGTPETVSVHKKFGSIWHTTLAFGSNYDTEGLYSFRSLSWPSTFTGTSLQQLTDAAFFQCGSQEAYQDLFKSEGKPWATLRNLAAAHNYFKEIKTTGMLAIMPFGQQANTLKVEVKDADIKMQGVSLHDLLEKYFVAPELGLLDDAYWADYKGFNIFLHVNRRKKISIKPLPPNFPVSPPLPVNIGQAQHKVVYGPYFSDKQQHSLFPYAATAGHSFFSKGYDFFLASNSRIMNPLYSPKQSDNGDTRTDYFNKQRSTNQRGGGALQNQLLQTLCGVNLTENAPEQYEELKDMLTDTRVFDKQNPYLQKSEEYQKQMKNLKYMLGLPFEITVKVDTEYLQVNDAKDDLKDDALKRDAFFASVHTVIALDVLKRMLPGFKRLVHDINQQKSDNQAKINTLFKPGQKAEAPAGTPAKPTAPKHVPKAAQAEHAQQAAITAPAGRKGKRGAATAADATAGDEASGRGLVTNQGTQSARAARLLSRTDQLHPTELASPSEPRTGKRKRASTPADSNGGQHQGLDMLAAAAEDHVPSQDAATPKRPHVSRGLLEYDAEPVGQGSDLGQFQELWQHAVSEGLIVESPVTSDIKKLVLKQFVQ